jgi:hypothetical protein
VLRGERGALWRCSRPGVPPPVPPSAALRFELKERLRTLDVEASVVKFAERVDEFIEVERIERLQAAGALDEARQPTLALLKAFLELVGGCSMPAPVLATPGAAATLGATAMPGESIIAAGGVGVGFACSATTTPTVPSTPSARTIGRLPKSSHAATLLVAGTPLNGGRPSRQAAIAASVQATCEGDLALAAHIKEEYGIQSPTLCALLCPDGVETSASLAKVAQAIQELHATVTGVSSELDDHLVSMEANAVAREELATVQRANLAASTARIECNQAQHSKMLAEQSAMIEKNGREAMIAAVRAKGEHKRAIFQFEEAQREQWLHEQEQQERGREASEDAATERAEELAARIETLRVQVEATAQVVKDTATKQEAIAATACATAAARAAPPRMSTAVTAHDDATATAASATSTSAASTSTTTAATASGADENEHKDDGTTAGLVAELTKMVMREDAELRPRPHLSTPRTPLHTPLPLRDRQPFVDAPAAALAAALAAASAGEATVAAGGKKQGKSIDDFFDQRRKLHGAPAVPSRKTRSTARAAEAAAKAAEKAESEAEAEAGRLAAEAAAKIYAKEAEDAKKSKAERLAAEKAEAERLAAEKAEAERLAAEKERLAAEKAAEKAQKKAAKELVAKAAALKAAAAAAEAAAAMKRAEAAAAAAAASPISSPASSSSSEDFLDAEDLPLPSPVPPRTGGRAQSLEPPPQAPQPLAPPPLAPQPLAPPPLAPPPRAPPPLAPHLPVAPAEFAPPPPPPKAPPKTPAAGGGNGHNALFSAIRSGERSLKKVVPVTDGPKQGIDALFKEIKRGTALKKFAPGEAMPPASPSRPKPPLALTKTTVNVADGPAATVWPPVVTPTPKKESEPTPATPTPATPLERLLTRRRSVAPSDSSVGSPDVDWPQ